VSGRRGAGHPRGAHDDQNLVANCASEHHVFWPRTRQPPSTFSALQLTADASEPAPGSEMLIDITLPEQIEPSAAFFCSSVANLL